MDWYECGNCGWYEEYVGANEVEECPACEDTDITTSDILAVLPED